MKRITVIMTLLALAVCLFSCAGATHKESGAKTGAIIGATGGAILGQVIGRNTESTLLGAGIGAAVGGLSGYGIGAYMDKQEQDLRAAMAASDAASIQRTQDVLTATFKSEVLFDYNSATLKPGAYPEIDRVAGVLNNYPQTNIRVEGHTDASGSEAYNQQLSERRAEAVRNAMIQRGVDPRRITAIGYGESQPISSIDAMNRRVNIVIIPM
jgi:outer membrane protein OmpA-like peptidoglycan-associated protein